jgi:hypothetical protein
LVELALQLIHFNVNALERVRRWPLTKLRRCQAAASGGAFKVADVRHLMHISGNIPVTAYLVAMSHAWKKKI